MNNVKIGFSLSLSPKMLGEAFGVLGKRVGVEGATNANRGVRPLAERGRTTRWSVRLKGCHVEHGIDDLWKGMLVYRVYRLAWDKDVDRLRIFQV